MRQKAYIGSVPYDESCAQTVHEDYLQRSRLECDQFEKAIIQKLGPPPEGAKFGREDNEVVVFYESDNEKAVDYAMNVEDNAPRTWAECNMSAPKLDDPEFTKTDLIPVPEGKNVRKWMSDAPAECDMKHDRVVHCKNKITNHFFDSRTKQGPWGNLCPQCFARYGVGVGTGMGQEYKKAVDGVFYKISG